MPPSRTRKVLCLAGLRQFMQKAFPSTLIQVGTREILLSAAVRDCMAICGGGHDAILDLYEGMPHIFQAQAPTSRETRTAIARAAAFFEANLTAR